MDLDNEIINNVEYIISRIDKNKGVYTVLITLALYKFTHPTQDIRQHKIELKNGFSGRSFDTQYVTPVLKELGLPAMAESGWLTRSLEQAYAYDKNYNGKITPKELKDAFLDTVENINKNQQQAKDILLLLLKGGFQFQQENKITINKIDLLDIDINLIIQLLQQHFSENYHTHGGSKLPVIAFYAIYSILVTELGRFKNCILSPLGSHTASDRTSKSGGDIEVLKNGKVFESLEIKLDKSPTMHMVRVAYDKINKFSISRYYILSGVSANNIEQEGINKLIQDIKQQHGCQLIVNGLYFSLKYYLRLISNPVLFMNKYIELVEQDKELQLVHKQKLQDLLIQFDIF
ncbi:hypothetical protein [Lonepinella sp. BR2474]|uniref:hypothetical protein n=1 Tax=Lonepinella sp. BR2474 TaxID=3434548 RepID=UPI003F6E38F1